MAKRLTDTEKWKKQWIKELSITMKLVWVYLLDNCNHAGIWDVEMDVLNLRLGTQLSEKEILDAFGDKIIPIDKGRKWFIPGFIEFQYGQLNPDNRVHCSVIEHLKRYGIKPLTSPLQRAKDMDKDKEKDKEIIRGDWPHLRDKEFLTAFTDYLIMRNKIKKPATEKAEQMALKELHKHSLGVAIKILNQSIMNSWQGIYPLKEVKQKEALGARVIDFKPPEYETTPEDQEEVSRLISETRKSMR